VAQHGNVFDVVVFFSACMKLGFGEDYESRSCISDTLWPLRMKALVSSERELVLAV
jgi:hypothetical protein